MNPSPIHLMSFGDHLEELRKRVVFAMLGLIPVFILGLVFGRPLLAFLTVPLTDALQAAGQPTSLLATSPFEPFTSYIKVSLILALLVAFPWIIFQVWLFIAPGLYKHERRFVYFLIPLSTALTVISSVFLYKVLLPISLYFLISFGAGLVQESPGSVTLEEGIVLPQMPVFAGDPVDAPIGSYWFNSEIGEFRMQVGEDTVVGTRGRRGGTIAQEYRIGEYVSLIFMLGLVFAVAFQLPVVMMLLSWVGIIRAADLKHLRRYVIFGCAIAGAMLTPQDPFSMVLLGGALYMLFEFGLILMRFVPARTVAGEIDIPEDGRQWH